MTVPHLGLRLAERVAARESQIVLGLDPDPGRLWPEAAAAAEAGAIGGDVPDTPPTGEPDFATEPVTRPSEEHAGNSFESFSEREG